MNIIEYARNAMYIEILNCKFYFSYNTLIGMTTADNRNIVHTNIWRGTTAKHLKFIDDATKEAVASRLSASEFQDAIKIECDKLGIKVPQKRSLV